MRGLTLVDIGLEAMEQLRTPFIAAYRKTPCPKPLTPALSREEREREKIANP